MAVPRIRKRTCHITVIVSRMGETQLRIRTDKDARSGRVAGGTAGRASRRARVAQSKAAETHDHDHDHDDEVLDTDVAIEVDQVESVDSADSADSVDSIDSADSADSADSVDSPDEPEADAPEAEAPDADADAEKKDND